MSKSDPNALIRRAALTLGFERDLLYEEHPLVTNSVCLATGPIREAYDVLDQAVVHRESGTCFFAQFRIGKTTAIRAFSEQLVRTRPGLPFGTVIAKGHNPCTERMYFTDLGQDYGLDTIASNTVVVRNRFVNTILAESARKKSTCYLLMIDEAQNYGAIELTFLRDAVNDIYKKNVTVITVMFGHPELRELRKKLVSTNRMDLVARFLLTQREFRGIRDKAEFTSVLKAHDDTELLEFPARSGICYSEFFLPLAWSSGWRLEQEADEAWRAFELTAQKFNSHQASNIGMTWINGAIRNFFFSQQASDRPGYFCPSNVWRDAVNATGYAASLVR